MRAQDAHLVAFSLLMLMGYMARLAYTVDVCGAKQCLLHNTATVHFTALIRTGPTHNLLTCRSFGLYVIASVDGAYSSDIGINTNTTSDFSSTVEPLHALCLRSWPAVRTVSLDLTASDSRYDCFSAAFDFSIST